MSEHYTYDEAHAVINGFMIGSGIREFCTKKCAGKCCRECNNPCHGKNRRITCSLYLCDALIPFILRRSKWYSHLKEYIDLVIVKILTSERHKEIDWRVLEQEDDLYWARREIESKGLQFPDQHFIPHSDWMRCHATFDRHTIDHGIAMLWDDLTLNADEILALDPSRVREE